MCIRDRASSREGGVASRAGWATARLESLVPKGHPPGLRARTAVALDGLRERCSREHGGQR
eukprot:1051130-Pyramimonas_sp.AAC.1